MTDGPFSALTRLAGAALPGRAVEVWLTEETCRRTGWEGPHEPRAAALLARASASFGVIHVKDGALGPLAAALLQDGAGLVVLHGGADARASGLLEDAARLVSAHLAALAEARAAGSERDFFRLIAEHATDTLVRGDLDGVRLYISPSVRDLLGYAPEELVGTRATELCHPDDLPAFRRMMAEVKAGTVDHARTEQRQRRKDGTYVWLEAFLRVTRDRKTGAPDGYVVSVRDISRRKVAEDELAFAAFHDPLTGLPNRARAEAHLSAALARWAGEGAGLAIMSLDLDHFKQVNDTSGHAAGDAVLRAAAARFREALGAAGFVARVGGDEFLVILEAGTDARASACALAERLVAAVATPIVVPDGLHQLGLSIGIALPGPGQDTPEALLRAVDAALYAAKAAGRNGWSVV